LGWGFTKKEPAASKKKKKGGPGGSTKKENRGGRSKEREGGKFWGHKQGFAQRGDQAQAQSSKNSARKTEKKGGHVRP